MRAVPAFLAVLCAAIGLTILLLLFPPRSFVIFWMLFAAIWATWLVLFLSSFNLLKANKRLVALYFATYDGTYVNGSDYEELRVRCGMMPDFGRYCHRGLPIPGFGDVVYLQQPFFYDTRDATTGLIKIHVEAATGTETKRHEEFRLIEEVLVKESRQQGGRKEFISSIPSTPRILGTFVNHQGQIPVSPPRVETRAHPTQANVLVETRTTQRLDRIYYPEVEMQVNVDVIFRLGVNLGPLLLAIDDDKLGHADLAKPESLANQLREKGAQQVVQEALTHAMKQFTWQGPEHIRSNLRGFEAAVIKYLRRPNTFFVQAGLLAPYDERIPGDPLADRNGVSVEAIDIAIEEPAPRAEALRAAINQVAIAAYDKEATRQRELGLTLALADRVEASQQLGDPVSYETALAANALTNSNLVAVGGFGGDPVLQMGAKLIGGKRGKGGPRKGPAPTPQGQQGTQGP